MELYGPLLGLWCYLVTMINKHKKLKPFLKWPGGKKWLAERLSQEIIAHKPNTYFEPFVGAGAIALAVAELDPTINLFLSDFNIPLMNLWKMIKKYPEAVYLSASRMFNSYVPSKNCYGNNAQGYYLARERFNKLTPNDGVEYAALMLYLNKHSFNGLYRENQKGEMNVPFGKIKSLSLLSLEEFIALANMLKNVILRYCSFEEVIPLMQKGDAGYFDPPYDEGFDAYTSEGFDRTLQIKLAQMLREASETRGVKIIASNSDTPFIRDIYSWANIEEVDEKRSIAANKDSREKAKCLLIRSK